MTDDGRRKVRYEIDKKSIRPALINHINERIRTGYYFEQAKSNKKYFDPEEVNGIHIPIDEFMAETTDKPYTTNITFTLYITYGAGVTFSIPTLGIVSFNPQADELSFDLIFKFEDSQQEE